MKLNRIKTEGYPDMKVAVGVFSATVISLIAITSLNLSSSSCSLDRISALEQVHYVKESSAGTLTSNGEEKIAIEANRARVPAAAAAGKQVCYREWELPQVANELESEKLWDKNTPEEQRLFTPVGVSAFLFVQFAAYRSSPSNFSIVGLSPKALQAYGNPGFDCSWVPPNGGATVKGAAAHYLPGIEYTTQYTCVVIHCNFDTDVGTDGTGGSLQIIAGMGSEDTTGLQSVQFVSLTEIPGEYTGSLFELPPKYDYMYCGSPLYGPISPQRVREWIAYHARLFGPRSHFIFYDAGGLDDDARNFLRPWVKLGRVTIMNFRQGSRYKSWERNQDVTLNDCLMQAKRMSTWAFFFDLDEYLYVPSHSTFDEVMQELYSRGLKAQQVTFDQRAMNFDHCVEKAANVSEEIYQRQWAMEKLVYQRIQVTENGGWMDHKYAVQTKYILAAGIHDHADSQTPDPNYGMGRKGQIEYVSWEDKLFYYHYRKIISTREELCKVFVDPSVNVTKFNNVTHFHDDRMAALADAVRQYELETIGPQLFIL